LPNVFCAQADGRWWHDHRTPVLRLVVVMRTLSAADSKHGVLHKTEKLKSSQTRIRIGSACPTIFGARSFQIRAHSVSVKRRREH
jgi:hypothetical protein